MSGRGCGENRVMRVLVCLLFCQRSAADVVTVIKYAVLTDGSDGDINTNIQLDKQNIFKD